MATKRDSAEKLKIYRKMFIGAACVAVALPWLLNLTSFYTLLAATVLVLPAVFLWKFTAVRVSIRILLSVILWAAPLFLFVIWCMGLLYDTYFSMVLISLLTMPAFAFAAKSGHKWDVVLAYIAAVVHIVETGFFVWNIIPPDAIVTILLYAATALVFFCLVLMAYPPKFPKIAKKESR